MAKAKINKNSDIIEVAAIVCEALLRSEINAVLSGGAVVSIYSDNEYESKDLDFVSSSDIKTISKALNEIGFTKTTGRHFIHPQTEFFIDFPSPPLAVGNLIIKEWNTINSKAGKIQLLTPTHSVMDRLAAYYHWNDKQSLDQALMIASRHPVKLNKIKSWSKDEGAEEKFEVFKNLLKSNLGHASK